MRTDIEELQNHRVDTTTARLTRWTASVAAAVYLFWALLLIAQKPGLQYDEALLVAGTVHMLYSHGPFPLPDDKNTWIQPRYRWFPLMTGRYVGAVKEYLCLPVFRIFGTRTVLIRLVAIFLAAIGVWGITGFLSRQVGWRVGGAAGLLLAINPAYVDLTAFDNNAVAPMMAAAGLLCLAMSHYLEREDWLAALWVGTAMGFGIWTRANFSWLLAALAIAITVVFRKRLLGTPVSHWAAGAAGGVLGGAPFLTYQIHSRGGTWEALDMFAVKNATLREFIYFRSVMLREVLLSDREHRAMWSGPAMPDWQRWVFPLAVLGACAVALLMRRGSQDRLSLWSKVAAIACLLLSAYFLCTRMEISEHHIFLILPVACVLVSLAGAMLIGRFRWGAKVAGALAALYLGSALFWQISAVRGLALTGGVGVWSDAINSLTGNLVKEHSGNQIEVVDWGLQRSLYVLSSGKLTSVEIFPDGDHQSWPEEIQKGGVFVINGPENRQFPKPTNEFLQALAIVRPRVHRTRIWQRNETEYAEFMEIEPNTAGSAAPFEKLSVSMADSRYARQLTGFHQIENNWRWTERRFSITLDSSNFPWEDGGILTMRLYLPDLVLQKLGPVTLSGQVNGHFLAPVTYAKPDRYTYKRALPAGWLKPGRNTFEFVLDKSILPSPGDKRELGIIVASAELEPL